MLKSPETYFEGKQLELARLVDKADAKVVYQYAIKLNLEDLNQYGREHMSVLVYSALKSTLDKKYLPVVTALLRAGADPLQKDGDDDFSFMSGAIGNAHQSEDLNLLRAALEAGINPDTDPDIGAGTPIILLVSDQGGLGAIRLLVEYGADVNRRDSSGEVALMGVIATLGLDEVNYLLDHGANPKLVDYYGVSFASMFRDAIIDLKSDPRLPKALAIRDRIIQMGAKWPPDTPEEFRAKYKAEYKKKTGKDFKFMPEPGYKEFIPEYVPAPVRKEPLQR